MVAVVVLAGAVPFVAGAAGAQQVDSCTLITEPGTYELTRDIVDSEQAICIEIRADNVVFDGGGNTIDGSGEGIGIYAGEGVRAFENVTVKNTVVTDWAKGIIYLQVMDGAITGNDVRRTTEYGIVLEESNGNAVTANKVIANTGDGIKLYDSDDNTLANNVVANNGDWGFDGLGIWLTGAHDNVLRNNTVSNNVLNGIEVTQSFRNELVDNTVTDNAHQGIQIASGAHDNVLRNNTISNNGGYGVYLHHSHNATMVGNVIESNGDDGICLLQFDNSTVKNNTIDDNGGDGVELDHSNSTAMMGNAIYDNADSGVALAGDSGHNYIYNNYFYNDENVAVESDYDGTGNVWSVARTPGTNVLGDPVVAGNYWANAPGTGFSQTCTDADGDGICDTQNALPGNNVDSSPLAPNTLVIQGTGPRAEYSFTVDRDLAGRSLTQEDELGDVSATGAVGPGADRYVFTSEIIEISVTGEAVVLVNGEELDIGQPETNTLVIRGDGSRSDYSFAVSGTLSGESLTPEDDIAGSSATGAVGPGEDRYVFTGELSDVSVRGDAAVLVNGKAIVVDRSHTLVIRGDGSRSEYSFTVSGDLSGESLTAEDDIAGSSATGAVGPGADSYTFTGELSDLRVRGDATVLVDGREIATSQQNTLTIKGEGPRAEYSFSVSGTLAGESLTVEDDITGASATGAVGPGADRYVFTGELTNFVLEGEATVLVNGEAVDPDQL